MDATGRAPAGFYRAAEVARMLQCSEWWVKEQARNRRIPYAWIGGSYRFTDQHVAAIIRLFEVMPGDEIQAVGRRGSAMTADPGDSSGRLRARPPRRATRVKRSAA